MNLKKYINENIGEEKSHKYYNERFCNLVLDYLGSYENFIDIDKQYLKENGYDESDFIEK